MSSTKIRGANRLIINQNGTRVTLKIFEVYPEFDAQNSMFPLIQKLLVLVLICLRLAMSAHTSLLNLFVQNQNVDQCVFSPCLPKEKYFLYSNTFSLNEQLFKVAFVFQYNTNVGLHS